MQDIFGSVRRSLVFRTAPPESDDSPSSPSPSHSPLPLPLVDKINSCIRKSRVFSKLSSPPPPPPPPPIRWRKGELIGCGAFGRVYMGMNLDSGELLAVKQVLIAENSASKEKAQAHIRELEEEVKLLKNLSHPNIVRYLGTVREEETLNILLEFVPGGSISSLLGKFGSFPEAVIRTYTKQLLLGLEYLHRNGIMHRDIKVLFFILLVTHAQKRDNKGCIKLADFGASKQVVELATVSGAKSMKGTPYWMAPEVILQTGHNFSADIWSVGCTYQEVFILLNSNIGLSSGCCSVLHWDNQKSHPPIPSISLLKQKDFLLKCLQKEPNLRPAASELLQHPFVTGGQVESHPFLSYFCHGFFSPNLKCIFNDVWIPFDMIALTLFSSKMSLGPGSTDLCNLDSLRCSTAFLEKSSEKMHIWELNNILVLSLMPENLKSFNPICEPTDGWGCKFDASPEQPELTGINPETKEQISQAAGCSGVFGEGDKDFSFPCGPSLSEDDDELTESKIRAFLDEKAFELKETANTFLALQVFTESTRDETTPKYLKLPPKSRSPSRGPTGAPSPTVDSLNTGSPGSNSRHVSNIGNASDQVQQDNPSPPPSDWRGRVVDAQQEPNSPKRQRKWKEELDQELERKREMMRQAGVGGKTSSPKDSSFYNRQRERTRFASPGK
ncbi:hypothetical protein RGQ29_014134 [Quercus rubra]|uniref:mitogen-activated protein kinase kinase kinase n=1 Tax=Quercus rubra TaxID=3512 RepID=A0AAN7FR56_QUERU|nr:hypothetical protein RGQ29_014134 [Quercus rubra]